MINSYLYGAAESLVYEQARTYKYSKQTWRINSHPFYTLDSRKSS